MEVLAGVAYENIVGHCYRDRIQRGVGAGGFHKGKRVSAARARASFANRCGLEAIHALLVRAPSEYSSSATNMMKWRRSRAVVAKRILFSRCQTPRRGIRRSSLSSQYFR